MLSTSEKNSRRIVNSNLRSAKALLWLVMVPVLIDYKPKGAQTWSAILYSVFLLISISGCIVLLCKFPIRRHLSILLAGLSALAFTLVTFTSGMLWGQDAIALARQMPPIVLLCVGVFSAGAFSNSGVSPQVLLDESLKIAGVGLVLNLLLVAGINGIDFDTVRYQVLSGGTPLIGAQLVALLLFGGWKPWTIFTSGLYVMLVLISVTRTQIAVVASMLLFAVVFAWPLILKGRALSLQVLALIGIVAAVLVVDAFLPSSPLDRWTQRFTSAQLHSGFDITAVTRAGETGYQIARLGESVQGLFFGFGAAAPNFYDGPSARIISLLLGQKAAYWTEIGVGHNNYVGTIYIGGLLAGGMLLITQFIALMKSAKVVSILPINGAGRSYLAPIIFSLTVVGYMAYGILGGTLGGRSACLLFGFSIGIVFWLSGDLKNQRSNRKAGSRSFIGRDVLAAR